MLTRKLPIGIDSFEKIRKNNYYYVDKTGLIASLLKSGSEATLFTRPRRFGKSLNMSMLEAFFSPLSDKKLFEGLKITGENFLCEKYMGKFPVIRITLKDVDAEDFTSAYEQVLETIQEAAVKVDKQVGCSDKIHPIQRNKLHKLLNNNIKNTDIYSSLYILSSILEDYYEQKVIILIDEYDVPLAKAYENGYYDSMVHLIRNILHKVLKTNDSLQFAVLTGCMQISKESIFTGLNNLKVRSVSDEEYDEYFGFTDDEVCELMKYYCCDGYYATMRDWYDGYTFGRTSVYCPWDVIMYCDKLLTSSNCSPENFWLNSSENQAVRNLIRYHGSKSVKYEIEALLEGETLQKSINPNLTYPEMYSSVENIWGVLYTTGYLTHKGDIKGYQIPLAIPNKEICNIFSEQILDLFREDVSKDGEAQRIFCDALVNMDVQTIEKSLSGYLKRTISIKDSAVRNSLKENFYHGMLIGILGYKNNWDVRSNPESGNGYSDIQIRDWENNLGIVIEVKYTDKNNLEKICMDGLKQIDEKHYTENLQLNKFQTILKYGIAFHLKECKVILQEERSQINE